MDVGAESSASSGSTSTSGRTFSSSCSIGEFVEEIDIRDIQRSRPIGQGSFGVVWHAYWRNIEVAVKEIQSEEESKAFQAEVRQLSRVDHPNIVRLYGAGMITPRGPMFLLMEYAENGSLYNVLHSETPSGVRVEYTAAHAISWALQTAEGVAYLHAMTPKPVIHRDLKPPNLLLVDAGRRLKICDFGTACEYKTHMTNAKGSAAWMAPEVFEGCEYTEKCDVFSWGIILWEVLTRSKPFEDIGNHAYGIMWAVHKGNRPPLIENCPKPIEELMVSCWSSKPTSRPSMSEIVSAMSSLQKFFPGYDAPLQYSAPIDGDFEEGLSTFGTNPQVGWPTGASFESRRFPAFAGGPDELRWEEEKFRTRLSSELSPNMIHDPALNLGALRIDVGLPSYEHLAAGALTAAKSTNSEEFLMLHGPLPYDVVNHVNLNVPGHQKRHSADLSRVTPFPQSSSSSNVVGYADQVQMRPKPVNYAQGRAFGHRRSSSYGSTSTGSTANPAWPSWVRPVPAQPLTSSAYEYRPSLANCGYPVDPDFINEAYLMLPRDLVPIPPDPTSPESMAVFDDHRRMAVDYVKMATEMSLLEASIKELRRELNEEEEHSTVLDARGQESLFKEYQKLLDDKDSFESLYKCLEAQLEAAKKGQLQA